MAKITLSLSAKTRADGKRELLIRASLPSDVRVRLKSGLFVNPKYFASGKIKKPRVMNDEYRSLQQMEKRLIDIESALSAIPVADKQRMAQMARAAVSSAPSDDGEFMRIWGEFESTRNTSRSIELHYRSLGTKLIVYQRLKRTDDSQFSLSVDSFDGDDFLKFYAEEKGAYLKHKELFTDRQGQPMRLPRAKGSGAMFRCFTMLSTFFNWCVEKGFVRSNPMHSVKRRAHLALGRPVYLTKEERDRFCDFGLSEHPELQMVRDVFCLQCFLGCRISDMMAITKDNISDGFLQYVPIKTRSKRAEVVRVPVTQKAMAILERYGFDPAKMAKGDISTFNKRLRKAMRLAGLSRTVTVIDPVTGNDVQKPLWQAASSHMARRTFIGVLYKQVKDPSLIGSMSGHKEGSTAFARYRDIDDEIKKDVASLLE